MRLSASPSAQGRVSLRRLHHEIVCWPEEAATALHALRAWIEATRHLGRPRA